uniref:JmjC domain-containing protein n=1 Tax=Phytophthora ramorum TaxID=164328 RepID=H3G7C5_PHYRM
LEREYWRLLSIPMHEQRLEVQYGSDVDTGANGSGFPHNHSPDAAKSLEELLQRYAQDDWNLNNMPKLPGSVLQHLDEDIKGVMVPWLYAGMCFSTFCWHVEDHNFYSTSYLHSGAPKTWYGIPCASAELMERTMKELTPELFGSQPDLHMQLVTMFSPKTLREHGVPVYRATHRPNEFIVTFPSAYHAGFNNGFNCAEAVNFATVDWLPWGAKSLRKYREFHKLPVFCHEALVCTLAETLVDGSDFDFEHTESFLLPAVEQLLQDYREFQRRVDDSNSEMHVAKREDEGLRCVTCKQYCYLQAVVCTRCRPPHGSNGGPTVGCLEHYPTMCKCGDPENFVYLYRHEAARLEEMLTNIRNRLNGVRAW